MDTSDYIRTVKMTISMLDRQLHDIQLELNAKKGGLLKIHADQLGVHRKYLNDSIWRQLDNIDTILSEKES